MLSYGFFSLLVCNYSREGKATTVLKIAFGLRVQCTSHCMHHEEGVVACQYASSASHQCHDKTTDIREEVGKVNTINSLGCDSYSIGVN